MGWDGAVVEIHTLSEGVDTPLPGGCIRIVQEHIHSTGVWFGFWLRTGLVDGKDSMRFKVMAEGLCLPWDCIWGLYENISVQQCA